MRRLAATIGHPYTGKTAEGIFGPFATEDDAADWSRDEGIDVDSSPRADKRRRAFILPFTPRS